jgi:hypothetical protein
VPVGAEAHLGLLDAGRLDLVFAGNRRQANRLRFGWL